MEVLCKENPSPSAKGGLIGYFCWPCGTDESFLRTCGNDPRFFSTLCDFSSKKFFTFIKVFGFKNVLRALFSALRFFSEKKLFFDVFSWGKAVFESYGYFFGYFPVYLTKTSSMKFTIMSLSVFAKLDF